MNTILNSAKIKTDTLLKARDGVNSTTEEKVFAINATINGTTAHVKSFINIPGTISSTNEIIHTQESMNFLTNRSAAADDYFTGEAHSHLEGHSFELSSHDQQEISRTREAMHYQIFFLFHKKSDGAVGYKAYNALGKRIRVYVTSHITGETRISEKSNDRDPRWENNFWGITANNDSLGSDDYLPLAA